MLRLPRPVSILAASAAVCGATLLGVDLFRDVQFVAAEQNVQNARQELANVNVANPTFREIHAVVEPSVVNIQVTKTIPHQATPLPPGFQQFFHQFGGGMNLPPQFFNGGDDGTMKEIGTGSGVIMDVDGDYGYILTNNHVAGGATEMIVTLADGRVIKDAQLVGADPKTDLAVVKIKADHLIPAQWGNSDEMEPGDQVLAFGSPFGYVGSMTNGIVSALHRQAGILGADGYENFIQVDAPINPGNSGGPLVNLRGQVVGINTAIATSNGGFEGIGFAIPSEEARPIYEQLKSTGKVVRGWLGVAIQNVSQASDMAASEGFKGDNGVLVREVLKESPATGQLKPGDIITSLDGKDVADMTQLRDAIAADAPGTKADLGVFRDGKNTNVDVTLGQMPANPEVAEATPNNQQQAQSTSTLGMQLGNVNDDTAQQFDLNQKHGAVVLQVEPNSPAAQAGLQPGDVITEIDHHHVSDAHQAEERLTKADLKSGISMQIDNSQGSELVFLKSAQG